ncbi:tRNA (adenosine(37)-N6)-dimethylallyltransferase MiaA [bacterium]|nr:tRNA (adenosine(37)-N6)-dimethylallyltransferase MiaA [bacterium]
MDPAPNPPLVLLAGPTATGKTALAVELAEHLDGEIISADSMQVYRGLAIGTAQPVPDETRRRPYHMVNTIAPTFLWSAADWLRETRRLIDEIRSRGRAVIVAGGTGLYFKVLTGGLFQTPGAGRSLEIRARLEAEWDEDNGRHLRCRLAEVDPEAAARIHENDKLRVVRALEVFESTGRSLSDLQAEGRREFKPPPAFRFVLSASREDLYRRIDARVVKMVEAGFLEEVRDLVRQGATPDWPAMKALGYPQMLDVVLGKRDLASAIEETQKISRRYAKQQIVLYRQWSGSIWLYAERGIAENARILEKVLEFGAPIAF